MRILICALFCLTLAACATSGEPRQKGIQSQEARVLEKAYYYGRATHPPIYTDSRISTLFRESIAPKTDGEDAEAQAAALAVMLGVIGDRKFATHLSRESSAVQKATIVYVKPLWTRHRLSYPETQELAASLKVR